MGVGLTAFACGLCLGSGGGSNIRNSLLRLSFGGGTGLRGPGLILPRPARSARNPDSAALERERVEREWWDTLRDLGRWLGPGRSIALDRNRGGSCQGAVLLPSCSSAMVLLGGVGGRTGQARHEFRRLEVVWYSTDRPLAGEEQYPTEGEQMSQPVPFKLTEWVLRMPVCLTCPGSVRGRSSLSCRFGVFSSSGMLHPAFLLQGVRLAVRAHQS